MVAPSISIAIPSLGEAKLAALTRELMSSSGIPVQLFMDSRSSQNELDVLHKAEVPYTLINNPKRFYEGMLQELSSHVSSEWLWIIDGDEWVGQDAVNEVLMAIRIAPENIKAIGLARRWVRFCRDGTLVYSRFPRLLLGDYQWRVFRHKQVVFSPVLHTPGFEVSPENSLRLPRRHALYHFDWIVHSLSARRKKLELYEELGGVKKRLAPYYLPEDREWVHFFRRLRGQEVTYVAQRMRSLASDRGWADEFRS